MLKYTSFIALMLFSTVTYANGDEDVMEEHSVKKSASINLAKELSKTLVANYNTVVFYLEDSKQAKQIIYNALVQDARNTHQPMDSLKLKNRWDLLTAVAKGEILAWDQMLNEQINKLNHYQMVTAKALQNSGLKLMRNFLKQQRNTPWGNTAIDSDHWIRREDK